MNLNKDAGDRANKQKVHWGAKDKTLSLLCACKTHKNGRGIFYSFFRTPTHVGELRSPKSGGLTGAGDRHKLKIPKHCKDRGTKKCGFPVEAWGEGGARGRGGKGL